MKEDTTLIDSTWMEKTGGFARDMTLRDHFAGAAAEYVSWSINTFELSAERCYAIADAMLEAREGK
jgi:hypothetical protein